MIADLEQGRNLTGKEPVLDRRFALNCMRTSLVHTGICLIYFFTGYFGDELFGWQAFATLFGVIWVVNLAYYGLVVSRCTRRCKDPVLTIPVTIWFATSLLVTAYFVDDFRISVIMLFLAYMLLASFRQRFRVLAGLSLYAVLGYAVVLVWAFQQRSMELQLSIEVLQWLVFTLICIGFVFTGSLINQLRARLSYRNVELARGLEEVREMAIRDELTGLFNRRHILEILEQQQALADSGGYFFSICYLDLDHFKELNDRFGHGIGDQVLQRFAEIAHASLRDADYIGRLGGEEFVLVLPDTDYQEAYRVGDRVRLCLAATDFTDLHAQVALTVSVGVVQYQAGEDLDTILSRADDCLYQAKEAGRNQLVGEPGSEQDASDDSMVTG